MHGNFEAVIMTSDRNSWERVSQQTQPRLDDNEKMPLIFTFIFYIIMFRHDERRKWHYAFHGQILMVHPRNSISSFELDQAIQPMIAQQNRIPGSSLVDIYRVPLPPPPPLALPVTLQWNLPALRSICLYWHFLPFFACSDFYFVNFQAVIFFFSRNEF